MKNIKIYISNEDTKYYEEITFSTDKDATEEIIKRIKENGELYNNDVINIYIEGE